MIWLCDEFNIECKKSVQKYLSYNIEIHILSLTNVL